MSQDPIGHLLSINVAQPQKVAYRGTKVATGIYKLPIEGPVMVRTLGIDGDAQADLKVHGGVDKAVYLYAQENYDLWSAELGKPLAPGHFGENLTVTGLLEDGIRPGDELTIGGAILQVTEPRFPCFKLGIKMADQRFLVRFQESGRSGFYCSVIQEGKIQSGDAITHRPTSGREPTILEMVRSVR